tara:strand:+ start:176 stop:943 length:768 start_codon:yes stop_codon:yes gene_type:complete
MLGLHNNLTHVGVLTGYPNVYSVDFDGSNDYVDTGNSFQTLLRDSFTISAWVKLDDGQSSANQNIFGTQKYDNYSGYFWIRIATNGDISLKHGTPTAEEFTVTASTNAFSDGATEWAHIVCVLSKASATSGTFTAYKDGISVGTSSSPGAGWNIENYANTNNAYIGATNITGTPSGHFAGLIDEVSIWDSAFSASDVTAIYNNGSPMNLLAGPNSGDLQAWWGFEEGSGTSAADSSTNSNTGTLTNGPAHSTDTP